MTARWTPDALFAADRNPLAEHYTRFGVSERLLLTGHSHQAWPDVAGEGHREAFEDAARLVDEKWAKAFDAADAVREGYARLLDSPDADIALGASVHDLLVRLLSALPLARRPRIVTTDAEFYSARRQLDRLVEEGVEVVRIPARPYADLSERIAAAVDDRTALVYVSSVLFDSAHIVAGLSDVARAARDRGAYLAIDAYHHLNVVPWDNTGIEDAYVLGGGYKYCQLGEGNGFMRVPRESALRPVVTGWFATFGQLDAPDGGGVGYPSGPMRFAGSTYDPTSHYRARRVFAFFEALGLTPSWLREVSQRQIGHLATRFDALDLDPGRIRRPTGWTLTRTAGFLALTAPRAVDYQKQLAARGVLTDARGDVLRFGPAPYLSKTQLEDAMDALREVVNGDI